MAKKNEKLPVKEEQNTIRVLMVSTYIGNTVFNAGYEYELEPNIAEEMISNGYAKRV